MRLYGFRIAGALFNFIFNEAHLPGGVDRRCRLSRGPAKLCVGRESSSHRGTSDGDSVMDCVQYSFEQWLSLIVAERESRVLEYVGKWREIQTRFVLI